VDAVNKKDVGKTASKPKITCDRYKRIMD